MIMLFFASRNNAEVEPARVWMSAGIEMLVFDAPVLGMLFSVIVGWL